MVRIFLSSPGDVADERTSARQLIDGELPKLPSFRGRLELELIAWDDPAAQIPMLATETPQESVNAARPRPATCDIVIVILWARMGTPLPDNVRKPNGEPYLSGTEWEYEDAVNSPRQPQPEVLVYRRTEEPKIGLRDPQKKEKEEQFERVEAFFARFRNADGSLKGGVNEYATPSEFKVAAAPAPGGDSVSAPASLPPRDEPPPIEPTIPAEYLDWLRRTTVPTSACSARSASKSHALTLSHVYVPALTAPPARTAGPRSEAGKSGAKTADERKPIPLLQRLDAGVALRPGSGRRRQIDLLPLGGAAEHRRRGPRHPVPAPEEFAETVPANLRGRLPLLVPLRDFHAGHGLRPRRAAPVIARELEEALAALGGPVAGGAD